MTTFNTGNPVGSSDPRDLYDNAENADFLINGDQPAYNDRFGISRKSWTGVEQQVAQQATEFAADQASRETTFTNFLNSSGFEYLGVYGAGVTFTEYNQYVVDAGEAWFIDPTTTLPYTTTGAGVPEAGALMSRGEALLRQEIGSGIRRVDSLAGLQSISGRFAGDVAYMVGRTSAGDGGEGEFRWDGSDLSASVSADTQQGVYVAPTSAPTGASGAWIRQYDKSNGTSMAWFGLSEASPDNSDAIKYCIVFAATNGVQRIRVPSGEFDFSESGAFGFAGADSNLYYPNIVGAGPRSTTFNLLTGGVQKYFYDNGDGNRHYNFGVIQGITFASDDRSYGTFMRQWSNGHEQGFTFRDCRFVELYDVLSLQGTANASENRFYNCKFLFIKNSVLLLNNQQAVNTMFLGCDAENIYKDCVYIDSDAGGSVQWIGGSIILTDDPLYGAGDGFLVNEQSTSQLGTGNQDFHFTVKTELKGDTKGLVNTGTSAGSVLTVKFSNSNLTTVTGLDRLAVRIVAPDRVTFESCQIPAKFLYEIVGVNEAQSSNGIIEFYKCDIPDNIPESVSITNFYGRVTGRGNNLSGTDTSNGFIPYLPDFDVNPFRGGLGDGLPVIKSASIFLTRTGWPFGTTADNNRKCVLPAGSIIKDITIYRPANGVSASTYQLFVGNDDKSEVYGSSAQDFQKADHSFSVNNLNKEVGTSLNERTINIWAEGGNVVIQDGYAVVEYI